MAANQTSPQYRRVISDSDTDSNPSSEYVIKMQYLPGDTDTDSEYTEHDPEDEYNEHDPEDEYTEHDPEDEYNEHDPEDEYNEHDPEDEYNEHDPEDEYNEHDPDDEYNEHDPEDEYNEHDSENESTYTDPYNQYKNNNMDNEYTDNDSTMDTDTEDESTDNEDDAVSTMNSPIQQKGAQKDPDPLNPYVFTISTSYSHNGAIGRKTCELTPTIYRDSDRGRYVFKSAIKRVRYVTNSVVARARYVTNTLVDGVRYESRSAVVHFWQLVIPAVVKIRGCTKCILLENTPSVLLNSKTAKSSKRWRLLLRLKILFLSMCILAFTSMIASYLDEGEVLERDAEENPSCRRKASSPWAANRQAFNPYILKRKQHPVSLQSDYYTRATVGQSCLPVALSTMSLPRTALASHPGTDNHWVKYLIQELTGVYVCTMFNNTIFNERRLSKNKNQKKGEKCIAITNYDGLHNYPLPRSRGYDKAIVIIRNPHDAVIEVLNQLKPNQMKDAHPLLERVLQSWESYYVRWLLADICTLVIQYEDLSRNMEGELRRIAHFLNINPNVLKRSHLNCIVRKAWYRDVPQNDNYSPLTEGMRHRIERRTRIVTSILQNVHGITWSTR